MPQFETTRRVRHSAEDMFALVADVQKYPRFVPLCRALAVRRRDTLPDGREVLVFEFLDPLDGMDFHHRTAPAEHRGSIL